MVHFTAHSGILFPNGQHSMEMTVLLLLTIPLTASSPLPPPSRTQADSFSSASEVKKVEVKGSGGTEGRALEPKIIPYFSENNRPDMGVLKNSILVKLRPRRAPQRGCQLGTCQLHNLANTLYHISKTSGKDESKTAHDPQGYGR